MTHILCSCFRGAQTGSLPAVTVQHLKTRLVGWPWAIAGFFTFDLSPKMRALGPGDALSPLQFLRGLDGISNTPCPLCITRRAAGGPSRASISLKRALSLAAQNCAISVRFSLLPQTLRFDYKYWNLTRYKKASSIWCRPQIRTAIMVFKNISF